MQREQWMAAVYRNDAARRQRAASRAAVSDAESACALRRQPRRRTSPPPSIAAAALRRPRRALAAAGRREGREASAPRRAVGGAAGLSSPTRRRPARRARRRERRAGPASSRSRSARARVRGCELGARSVVSPRRSGKAIASGCGRRRLRRRLRAGRHAPGGGPACERHRARRLRRFTRFSGDGVFIRGASGVSSSLRSLDARARIRPAPDRREAGVRGRRTPRAGTHGGVSSVSAAVLPADLDLPRSSSVESSRRARNLAISAACARDFNLDFNLDAWRFNPISPSAPRPWRRRRRLRARRVSRGAP